MEVTKLVTGDRDEDVVPIYFDGRQLWCYSSKKAAGLHARDPVTMNITTTQLQVEQANVALVG
ncbi:hypothetical protein AAGG49_22340, partial [Stenotrophomonas maltophilia]|uniref:hypothetical protein n=1 Tax=Stenotrophomonas maltophilia TaxID=40324 RepID=UPI00313F0C07